MVRKMKKENMELNRETAMRLWNKTFGKKTKVKDFAGREIVKGAYNDRSSDYGWNVDHILPQSRGGKTADHNLICCHILTNDEKADRFPAFKANETVFEIIKVENHYEIRQKQTNTKQEETDEELNFYDSASGIRFFKKLKGIQNKKRFVGSILVRLQGVINNAVIDFIERFFDEENISYSMSHGMGHNEIKILATNYNMPFQEDISKLLDKCVLLNTYMADYFLPMEYILKYDICYQVNYFEEKQNMYLESQKINFDDISSSLDNSLFINELVYENTAAKDKEKEFNFENYTYCEFDYVVEKLSKNLRKEISK